MARIHAAREDHAAVERCVREGLAIREKAHGRNHADVAMSVAALAEVLRAGGKTDEIEKLYLRALRIWEKTLGPNHPNVASALNNIALMQAERGDAAGAEPRMRRAVGILERALGPDPYLAAAMRNHAGMLKSLGREEEATELERRAEKMLEQVKSRMPRR
jgi:tetratricopeptide (TPR) repeat protein